MQVLQTNKQVCVYLNRISGGSAGSIYERLSRGELALSISIINFIHNIFIAGAEVILRPSGHLGRVK